MNVLLTGSSGWLGACLSPMLKSAGHTPIGLDIVPGPTTNVVGSIADEDHVAAVFRDARIEAVIHAGALHKPDIRRSSTQDFIDSNVSGTLNLLAAAAAHGVDRFVMTSTTSLMVTAAVRDETGSSAIWMDESFGPLAPRNIYGVSKLAAEGLCRLYHREAGLNSIVLRTSRFFPESDDSITDIDGENLKANEFLHRRLTREDAARAHLFALEVAADLGHEIFVVSAPTPFVREDCADLKRDAAAVIQRLFPDAADLYRARGWVLPSTIGRVYDGRKFSQATGFEYQTSFGSILDALRGDGELPFTHDPAWAPVRPTEAVRA